MVNFRCAFRNLRAAPGFTATAILSLSIGIGGTVSMFTLVKSILLKPLAYPEPDRLVRINQNSPFGTANHPRFALAPMEFLRWRKEIGSFESLALLRGATVNPHCQLAPKVLGPRISGSSTRQKSTVKGSLVEGRAARCRTWRSSPHLAQRFRRTHTSWQQDRFGWLLREVRHPRRICDFPRAPTDLEVALPRKKRVSAIAFQRGRGAGEIQHFASGNRASEPGSHCPRRSGTRQFAAGVSIHGPHDFRWWTVVDPLPDGGGRPNGQRPGFVFAVGFVLLIACLNLANLSLMRMAQRTRELAVRAALGAQRRDLLAYSLAESSFLALIGTIGGVLLSVWITDGVVALASSELPRLDEASTDVGVLLFSAAVCVLCTLFFGVAPAWRASTVDPLESINSGGRADESRRTSRFRSRPGGSGGCVGDGADRGRTAATSLHRMMTAPKVSRRRSDCRF